MNCLIIECTFDIKGTKAEKMVTWKGNIKSGTMGQLQNRETIKNLNFPSKPKHAFI